MYNKIIREFFIWGESGDDCLTVSIWAPLNPTNVSLPVFIWIYGGGDTTGGSSVPYQNPQKWVQRTQSHIVVSLQYRLNFFGNPNGPGLTDNLGFWDTRMAMEWTRDNIAAFGGDPTRMVLWGQSAGAGQVAEQSLAFLDDPIVWGYIEESGAAYGARSPYTDTTHANWTFIADELGCTGDAANVTKCLQTAPQSDIEALIQFRVDTGKTPAFSFESKPNDVTTFANSTAAYLAGHYNPAPKILAHTQVCNGIICGSRPRGLPFSLFSVEMLIFSRWTEPRSLPCRRGHTTQPPTPRSSSPLHRAYDAAWWARRRSASSWVSHPTA